MTKNYKEEVTNLIQKYKKQDIEFGKDINILLRRIKATKEEVETEILTHNNLVHVEKQEKDKEIRYGLYYLYSRKKGRKYVITFRDKLRIITIIPLGKRTLKKYRKKGLYTKDD